MKTITTHMCLQALRGHVLLTSCCLSCTSCCTVIRRAADIQIARQSPSTAHISPCSSVLQAVKRLLENCCSDDATLNVVEQGYHELFLGPEKEQVTQTLSDWLLRTAEKAKSHSA